MRLEIRAARLEDAAAMAVVKVQSWRAAYAQILPSALLDGLCERAERALWEQSLRTADADFQLAVRDGETVGYGVSGPSEAGVGEVFALYVLPAHQSAGVGAALMERALSALRHRRLREAILWVFEENRRARAFYDASGFRPDGGLRTELGAPAVRYRRAL